MSRELQQLLAQIARARATPSTLPEAGWDRLEQAVRELQQVEAALAAISQRYRLS